MARFTSSRNSQSESLLTVELVITAMISVITFSMSFRSIMLFVRAGNEWPREFQGRFPPAIERSSAEFPRRP